MARNVTLAQMIEQVRLRTDTVGDPHITDSEITSYLNGGLAELWGTLVTCYEDYYATTGSISTSSGVERYSLPSDLFKLTGVETLIGGEWRDVPQFMESERNRQRRLRGTSMPFGYRMKGTTLELLPAPSDTREVRLRYVPPAPVLSASAETFDGINGYEEYAILDASMKCCLKQDTQKLTTLRDMRDRLGRRIETEAEDRNAGDNQRAVDTSHRWMGLDDPWGDW